MNTRIAVQLHGCIGKRLCQIPTVNGLGYLVAEYFRCPAGIGIAENQNRNAHAGLAQLNGLVQHGYSQAGNTVFQHDRNGLLHAMTIGVGFDHGHDLRAAMNRAADPPDIPSNMIEIDFRPRSI